MAVESTRIELREILKRRILVLDGAMGSLLQSYGLTEADFRGDRFADHNQDLKGNNDILSLTRPDVVEEIHRTYLGAGADIISTNSFTATAISQIDYSTEAAVYDINRAAAELARRTADEFTAATPEKPRFVAGSIGPTNRSCSMSPDVDNPGHRAVTFDQMCTACAEAIRGLLDGKVDLLLIETVFDTLNAKAALFAATTMLEERGLDTPIWISGTISDKGGRILSGQTTQAFYISVEHSNPFCVGLNCSFGADMMRPHLKELSSIAACPVSVHPNAGLPNELGEYDETPEHMASTLREFAKAGLVNIVGGCCGSNPDHIRAIVAAIDGIPPRKIPAGSTHCYLSGLQPLVISPESLFVNIGERTNVSGSAKFANLIKSGNYEDGLKVARRQVKAGAQIIDVSMDDPMLDTKAALVTFLNLIAAEPDIAAVPVMIDSSQFDIIEAGLKCLQGKGIVNSISLKDGPDEFKQQAALIRKYGAAVIVMAFDEEGQGDTYHRKVDICTRSYQILTEELNIPPQDIIFDLNVFAVATGIDEHRRYAIDFIEACHTIKDTLPHALVSGGISNLSFAFRGNNTVREAMHSVFLFHAIQAGMSMGIVNAGQLTVYNEISDNLRNAVEDVILDRSPDATDQLIHIASQTVGSSSKAREDLSWRDGCVEDRLAYAMIHGILDDIKADTSEALEKLGDPIEVIEGPLMSGMATVGKLFGDGQMFLPQVIKTARVMKRAVSVLEPHLGKDGNAAAGPKVLLATVKGDIHDIGKNIVAVLLQCNGCEIIDLGVRVPAEEILEAATEHKVDIIGLSGLIAPSLEEMLTVAREMERRGFSIPLIIGGATTSKLHTAVKINPLYPSGPVVYTRDATKAVEAVSKLSSKQHREQFIESLRTDYEALRQKHSDQSNSESMLSLEEARKRSTPIDWHKYQPIKPRKLGVTIYDDFPLADLVDYIDWSPLFRTWSLPGQYPKILDDTKCGEQARTLIEDARTLLNRIIDEKLLRAQAVVGLFSAATMGDDIQVTGVSDPPTVVATAHFLRRQKLSSSDAFCPCLSDFVAPRESGVRDYLGAFALTTGIGLDSLTKTFTDDGNDYQAIMAKAVAIRLAEALSERVHQLVRTDLWGYSDSEDLSTDQLLEGNYSGIRPAPGYPACPDHTEKRAIFELLKPGRQTNIELTESCGLIPAASICGWYFSHPDSHYFAVGKIGRDQVVDYAERTGSAVDEVLQNLAVVADNMGMGTNRNQSGNRSDSEKNLTRKSD